MADRDVAGLVRGRRQAHPGEPRDDAVDAIGFGVERDMAQRGRLVDPSIERGLVGDGLVLRTVDLLSLGRSGTGRLLVERRHDVIDAAAAAASPLRAGGAVEPGKQRLEALVGEEFLERLLRDALEHQPLERLGQR